MDFIVVMMDYRMIDSIFWLGHSTFRLETTPSIYLNPWRVTRAEQPADVILISRDHYEQFSPADIAKLRADHTTVIAPEAVAAQIEGALVLRPWQSVTVGRACIKGVPAYAPGEETPSGLGFVISINTYDLYYAGVTTAFPAMLTLRPDIAILPIDGDGGLSASEAAEVIRQMRPRCAIPCNWTSGTRVNAHIFEREVGDAAQVVLPSIVR